MTIKVNRYNVRFQGKTYGPGRDAGQIITGLSEEEESLLIAGSGGTIERVYDEIEPAAVVNEPEVEAKESEEPEHEQPEIESDTEPESGENNNDEDLSGAEEGHSEDEDPGDAKEDIIDPNTVSINDLIKPVETPKKASTSKKAGK